MLYNMSLDNLVVYGLPAAFLLLTIVRVSAFAKAVVGKLDALVREQRRTNELLERCEQTERLRAA